MGLAAMLALERGLPPEARRFAVECRDHGRHRERACGSIRRWSERERPVLDAVGLVSPTVLRHYIPENAAPWLEIVKSDLPEWCVLRPGELQHILDGSRASGYPWEDTYEKVRTVSYSPRVGRESETFIIFRLRKRGP